MRCFNPLPSPKRGETPLVDQRRRFRQRFNPLPSPKRGETLSKLIQATDISGFNPLPSPKRGETIQPGYTHGRNLVSIRSPHRSEGRRLVFWPDALINQFQSAPLTEARGD